MKLLIPSLLSLFLVACGNDSSTSVNNSDDERISYITDSRDGQKYKTVTIGSQIWMAQNLNFETENSYCYSDDPSNCSKYGRLYTWAAAMAKSEESCGYGYTCGLSGTVRGACPKGWHVPSQSEWNELFTAVGGSSTAGTKLKNTTSWNSSGNGTDDFGFSALPAGNRVRNGSYYGEGDYAYFWSSTEYDSYNVYRMILDYEGDEAVLDGSYKSYGFSVRCLKD